MKTLIYIPCWKRPEILTYCLIGLNNLYKLNTNIEVAFVLSENDPCFYVLQNTIKDNLDKNIVRYIIKLPFNDPLGLKMNEGLKQVEKIDFDYLMNLGSDDLLNPLIFSIYEPYFAKKTLYFGVNHAFFIDFYTKKTVKMRLNDSFVVFGAGRMIHKSILEQMNFKIYDSECVQGLDTNSSYLIRICTSVTPATVKTAIPMILDIKTNTNINHFDFVEKAAGISQHDSEKILKHFNIEL
jgi:hypothetical protein